jgi:SAM-dependent methyltransferase
MAGLPILTAATDISEVVRDRYGAAARRVQEGQSTTGCCGPCGCGDDGARDPITRDLYDQAQTAGLPIDAVLASLGCGNPTALAELLPGQRVLDLGSGGGIDVLLSAHRVGPTGFVYGVDMTPDMLALARTNAAAAGVTNVEFREGRLEALPLADNSVDVIISNCVINLSGDKRQVLREAFRVLAPGGRFAVSDVVVREGLPDAIRRDMGLWTGCVSGALQEEEFLTLLAEAGFVNASIEPTRIYTHDDALALITDAGLDPALTDQVAGKVMAAFVRADKPAMASADACCGPSCCGPTVAQ